MFIAGVGLLNHPSWRVETLDQSSQQERPAVDGVEEQELKRQGNGAGRDHEHPHRHQGGGHHHIDHQEGEIDQKTDEKSRFDLGHDERGIQNIKRDIVDTLGAGWAGAGIPIIPQFVKLLQVGDAGLVKHPFLEGSWESLGKLGLFNLSLQIRLDGVVVGAFKDRIHNEGGHDQADAHHQLVRKSLGAAQGALYVRKGNGDPDIGCARDHKLWDEGHGRGKEHDLKIGGDLAVRDRV